MGGVNLLAKVLCLEPSYLDFKDQLTFFFVDCILLSFPDKLVPCTGEEGEDLTFLRNPSKPLQSGSRGEI